MLHFFPSLLCYLLATTTLLVVNALPIQQRQIRVLEDGQITAPRSFQTVSTIATDAGFVTMTCDITQTPIGDNLVREEKSCSLSVLPTNATPPPDSTGTPPNGGGGGDGGGGNGNQDPTVTATISFPSPTETNAGGGNNGGGDNGGNSSSSASDGGQQQTSTTAADATASPTTLIIGPTGTTTTEASATTTTGPPSSSISSDGGSGSGTPTSSVAASSSTTISGSASSTDGASSVSGGAAATTTSSTNPSSPTNDPNAGTGTATTPAGPDVSQIGVSNVPTAGLPTTPVNGAPASGTQAAANGDPSASDVPFSVPGRKIEVLPIGLGVFAGISVIALIVVGLVTYERTKYRKAFRQRRLAETGAAMGYGGMAERGTT